VKERCKEKEKKGIDLKAEGCRLPPRPKKGTGPHRIERSEKPSKRRMYLGKDH